MLLYKHQDDSIKTVIYCSPIIRSYWASFSPFQSFWHGSSNQQHSIIIWRDRAAWQTTVWSLVSSQYVERWWERLRDNDEDDVDDEADRMKMMMMEKTFRDINNFKNLHKIHKRSIKIEWEAKTFKTKQLFIEITVNIAITIALHYPLHLWTPSARCGDDTKMKMFRGRWDVLGENRPIIVTLQHFHIKMLNCLHCFVLVRSFMDFLSIQLNSIHFHVQSSVARCWLNGCWSVSTLFHSLRYLRDDKPIPFMPSIWALYSLPWIDKQ